MERPIEEEILIIALQEFITKYGSEPNMPLIYAVVGKLVLLTSENVPPPSVLNEPPGGAWGVELDNVTAANSKTRLIIFIQLALVRLMREHGISLPPLPEDDRAWLMKRAIHIPNIMNSLSEKDYDLVHLQAAMVKVCEVLEQMKCAHPG